MQQDIIQQLYIDQIVSRPQVRREFDSEKLAELAQTIKTDGIQQPIRARRDGDHYIIVTGERRWRAAKLAGLKMMPVIVVDHDMTAAEILHAQLIENIQRADLSSRDKSVAIQRLLSESNLTATQVAAKLGLSPATVSKLLSLSTLPEPILAEVDAGTISLSGGYELSQITDPIKQQELATRMVSGQLTRDALVGAKKAAKTSVTSEPKPARMRVTARLDANRVITLVGGGLTSIEDLRCWLESLLAKARKASSQSLTLDTFIKMFKDQAKA